MARLGVSSQEVSANGKTGKISTTYASFKTCPASCPLKEHGCYAEDARTGMHLRKLGKQAEHLSLIQLAENEASAIDDMSGKRPLRLHVGGDCSTEEAAEIVSAAADRYRGRFGQVVWTYTHAWRDVSRKAWGLVNVLASVHTIADAKAAMSRGYMPAIVYTGGVRRRSWKQDGIKVVPCPQQSNKERTCRDCLLCSRPLQNTAIAFHTHGNEEEAAALTALNVGE